MLSCWNGSLEKSPPMSTLQLDLDDFRPALIESKYDYCAEDYMRMHGLTSKGVKRKK